MIEPIPPTRADEIAGEREERDERPSVVHVSLRLAPTLSVDDPESIDW
jgi:hypothetical protein